MKPQFRHLSGIAIAQLSMLRAARLESGVFTVCLDLALNDNGTAITPMSPELVGNGDIEITRLQNRNYALANGFHRLAHKDNTVPLFLRYRAQTQRLYRRAIEEFDRLKALRPELPNEPISPPNQPADPAIPTNPDSPATPASGGRLPGLRVDPQVGPRVRTPTSILRRALPGRARVNMED